MTSKACPRNFNFNPHGHVLAADGAFLPDGRFVTLLAVPEVSLARGLSACGAGVSGQERRTLGGGFAAAYSAAPFRLISA
jgi:hypothetical protein